jgi:hypothetical protein
MTGGYNLSARKRAGSFGLFVAQDCCLPALLRQTRS